MDERATILPIDENAARPLTALMFSFVFLMNRMPVRDKCTRSLFLSLWIDHISMQFRIQAIASFLQGD